jgi:molybdopterin converting factor subunit 1
VIRLLYFAWVRERIGVAEEALAIAAPTSLRDLLDRLAAQSPGHASALADRSRLRFAVNQDFVGADALVRAGDEVALFPPVTGG